MAGQIFYYSQAKEALNTFDTAQREIAAARRMFIDSILTSGSVDVETAERQRKDIIQQLGYCGAIIIGLENYLYDQ